MSIEAILPPPEKSLREEMLAFVQSVHRQFLLDIDAYKVASPRAYLQWVARRNLLQRSLHHAVALIGVGLGFYVLAVVSAALAKGGWTPP